MKRLLALLSAGALLSLAGCGQAADPPAEADPTPRLSPSSAGAKQLSPEETIDAWVAAYNAIEGSGDASLVHGLQGPECRTCDNLVGSLVETIKGGGSYRGGKWHVVRTHLKSRSKTKAVADALISMAAGSISDGAGAPFRHFGAQRAILEFDLRYDGTSWYVSFLGWLS